MLSCFLASSTNALGQELNEWQSSPAAYLELPQQGMPGQLIMPDGTAYQLVEQPDVTYSLSSEAMGMTPSSAPASGGASDSAKQDNGTNPAQNITTCIVSNEYYELDGGNQINTSYARLKFPIYDKRGSLLVEVPFTYYDFTAQFPESPEVGGIGDVKFQVSYNTWTSCDKKLTMINFLEFYVPSADTVAVGVPPGGNELTAFNVGTGKYVLGPGMGFVYMAQPNFIIAPLYFYETSIAGDGDRPMIRRGKWRIFAMYAWQSGAYILPEFQIVTNYKTGNNDTYIAPEFGYSSKGTTLYCKPGAGLSPDQNDRQWGFELGMRVQF
ncbi:hypothetical protein [Aeoliella mucimassa]|nr:hypothetical protein [Aeoliella mucimassa]